jgi:hypothetical protein
MDIHMNQTVQVQAHRTYIPAVSILRATYRKSWNKIPVATTDAPGQICGIAIRVGYTGRLDQDLAIYRLKVRAGQTLPVLTIPGFFVIDQGMFIDYDHWLNNKEAK